MRTFGFWVLIVSLGAVGLNAQSSARLAARSGMVEILRNNQWLQLLPGEAVNSGERLRTGNDSSAAIAIDSGQVITLSSNSEIQIQLTDPNKRTHIADGQRLLPQGLAPAVCPGNYFYPYVMYGNTGVQMQPFTGYAPGQIVPPMTDPLRPPVHYPANPFPVR